VFDKTKPIETQELVVHSKEDTITPLATIFSSRKRQETYQYWFSNSQGEATVWTVNSQNTLRSLVESLVKSQQPLRVRSYCHYKKHLPTDRAYWMLGNVELLA
jgi:hypothetical protein